MDSSETMSCRYAELEQLRASHAVAMAGGCARPERAAYRKADTGHSIGAEVGNEAAKDTARTRWGVGMPHGYGPREVVSSTEVRRDCSPGRALEHGLGGGAARFIVWRPGRDVRARCIEKRVSHELAEIATCIVNECGMPRKASRLLEVGWKIVVEQES